MAVPIATRLLNVRVFATRALMGKEAALNVRAWIEEMLEWQGTVSMVFAAAPSQDEFLDELAAQPGIEWGKIYAFHLDEYVGMPRDAGQRFARYLDRKLFRRVPFKEVHYIDTAELEPEEACEQYAARLAERPLGIACIGIGENGHIAFNDPQVADFEDPELVKTVALDDQCRQQQVNDGCFSALDEVPTRAVTLTIPAILAAQRIACVVPGATKRKAVWATLEGPISPQCPASVLRRHRHVALYLDADSAQEVISDEQRND